MSKGHEKQSKDGWIKHNPRQKWVRIAARFILYIALDRPLALPSFEHNSTFDLVANPPVIVVSGGSGLKLEAIEHEACLLASDGLKADTIQHKPGVSMTLKRWGHYPK